jgi:dolichol kinase
MEGVLELPQLSEALGALTRDMHQFLLRLHDRKAAWGEAAWVESVRNSCRELEAKTASARAAATARWELLEQRLASTRRGASARYEALSESLDNLAASLRIVAAEVVTSSRRARCKEWCDRLAISYEDLVRNMRRARIVKTATARLSLPHIKPVNYARNIFHVFMGVMAVAAYELLLDWKSAMFVMAGLSAFVIAAEVSRAFVPGINRMLVTLPVFKQIIRPREMGRINSASSLTLTLTAMCLLAPMPAVEVGLLVLALADPAASLLGMRYGRRKLWKSKSVLGTLAFLAVALLVSLGVLALRSPLSGVWLAAAACCVAVASAATELFSDRLDDNFSVLAIATGVAALWIV